MDVTSPVPSSIVGASSASGFHLARFVEGLVTRFPPETRQVRPCKSGGAALAVAGSDGSASDLTAVPDGSLP